MMIDDTEDETENLVTNQKLEMIPLRDEVSINKVSMDEVPNFYLV